MFVWDFNFKPLIFTSLLKEIIILFFNEINAIFAALLAKGA